MRLIENGGIEWKGMRTEERSKQGEVEKGIKGRKIREKSLSISALTWHSIKHFLAVLIIFYLRRSKRCSFRITEGFTERKRKSLIFFISRI